MAKRRINKEIEKKIKLFAQKLNQLKVGADSLILFGSHAKGSAKSYSDIDICVVYRKEIKDVIEEEVKLRLIADDIDWRIEPHILLSKDLTESNPFASEVLSTGIKTYP